MSRRLVTDRSAEPSGRNAGAASARPHLFHVETGNLKRIDRYIDYFGDGARRPVVTADLCGESVLDADGAR